MHTTPGASAEALKTVLPGPGHRTHGRDARPLALVGGGNPLPSDDPWTDIVATLDMAFQPIVNIHTGACYGYEALLRNVEAAGFASIQDFFDSCHALGILSDMEMLLREKAVSRFTAIPHHRQAKLFINLDNRCLGAADLPLRTRKMLDRFGIPETSVVFELSERQPVGQPAQATEALMRYKRQNFRLAIDDFGTGFSGLQMLYFAEPDFLKIDRFFISDIASDSKKKLFLAQIVHIAHLLGVVVLAEGVETEREYFVCKDIGCDLVQGYLVQRPTLDLTQLRPHYDDIETLARRERRVAISDQKLIGDQIQATAPIMLDAKMEQVFERFRAEKASTFFPVVDAAGEPVGIVREKDLKGYAYSPFGKDLISNKSFGRTLKDFVSRCPMADLNTRAENLLQAYSAVENSEGILIVDGMKYVGFLSAHSLLRVINEKNLAAARDQNPLSKLPGNNLIHEYVSESLAATDTETVLVYFDFDNFKPFNDKYGFRLGDRAILLFAELLAKALRRDTCFAGHIGGDDFFAGFHRHSFEDAARQCAEVVATFGRDVESFYDDDTRRTGYIVGQDRLGNVVRFPLMTVSAALVHLPIGRGIHTVDEVSQLIATLKKEAKTSPEHLCSATLTAAV